MYKTLMNSIESGKRDSICFFTLVKFHLSHLLKLVNALFAQDVSTILQLVVAALLKPSSAKTGEKGNFQ